MTPKQITEITIKVKETGELVDYWILMTSMLDDFSQKGYIDPKKWKSCQNINRQIFNALWPEQQILEIKDESL